MFIRSYITNVKLYLELQPTTTPSIVHCRYYMFMHLYTIHHKALVHWTIEQYIYNSIINTTLIPRYFHTIHTIFLGFSVSIFDVSIHHLNASKKNQANRLTLLRDRLAEDVSPWIFDGCLMIDGLRLWEWMR